MTVNGKDYSYSVSLDIQGPSGPEPEPVSLIGGPFADEHSDVTYPLMCTASIEDTSNYSDSFNIWNNLLDPNGNRISPVDNNHSRYGPYLSGSDTWNLDNPVEGTYTCSTTFFADGYNLGTGTDQKNLSYSIPTGETSTGYQWSGTGWSTAYLWQGHLSPSTPSLGGRVVTESDGGNSPATVDSCWWSGSVISKITNLSQGQDPGSSNSWTVQSDNSYSYDQVGWSEDAVSYYRSNFRDPCQFELNQNMTINRPGQQGVLYKTNRIKAGFTISTVWSYRDGQVVSKNW